MCFFCPSILSPFINKLLSRLTKKKHEFIQNCSNFISKNQNLALYTNFNHPLVPFKFPIIILQYQTFHVAALLQL